MTHHTTLRSGGRITLPKPLRDRLGLAPGTKLRFELQPDGTALVFVAQRPQDVKMGAQPLKPGASKP